MTTSSLIYTHRSPLSSDDDLQATDGEQVTSASSVFRDQDGNTVMIRPRMPRAVEAEEVADDSKETHEDKDKPKVPPLITFEGNRTDYRCVIDLLGDSARSRALKSFKGRHGKSQWSQDQKGWLENVSLLASIGPFSLDPTRLLYCSKGGKLCCQPDWCFRCNLDQRVEPLQKTFEDAFARRPHWHSLVMNYERNANKAGIWTGPRNNRRALLLPHKGNADGRFLRFSPSQLDFAKLYFDFLFHILQRLQKAGIIDGWIAVAEPSLSFWPDPNSKFYWWNNIDHAFLPHIHVLVCGYHPFGEKMIRAIYDVLQDFLGNWFYANLWFDQVTSQAGIGKWINYCVKPVPLAKWYVSAIRAGCDLPNLNLIFDDLALETCPGLMSQIYSPRRSGILNTNSGDACILNPVPVLLTRKQLAQCKDGKFYQEHEESFWRSMEKRDQRQGRNSRYRTRTHKAALRRISAWKT